MSIDIPYKFEFVNVLIFTCSFVSMKTFKKMETVVSTLIYVMNRLDIEIGDERHLPIVKTARYN